MLACWLITYSLDRLSEPHLKEQQRKLLEEVQFPLVHTLELSGVRTHSGDSVQLSAMVLTGMCTRITKAFC